ncbi:Rv3235 family protein [Streptomyces sp. NPDC048362]|uniref:Rv3235 family protein n=1 Tax=Streptomyces sp. NPDC048362 TaxID=3365539 RepID=UPI0037118FAB
MNKVMNRAAQPRPRHRPPTRHDTRRPAGAPPRAPSRNTVRRTTAPAPVGRASGTTAPSTPTRPEAAHAPRTPSPLTGPQAARTLPGPAAWQPRPTDLFADRLVAVLSGQRPVHWMLRHTAGRAYDDLARLAALGPLRTRGTRPVVHDIGYFVPRDGAIEAFARIAAGDQLRALAFRLEQGPDLRWRCTAVEAGPTNPSRPTAAAAH